METLTWAGASKPSDAHWYLPTDAHLARARRTQREVSMSGLVVAIVAAVVLSVIVGVTVVFPRDKDTGTPKNPSH
jgi:hypothetical protein